ncbi:MAG: hypothetical protein QXD05_02375 [Candidatus Pacearchaeota archaeon]
MKNIRDLIKNNKGLSDVLAALIIILLVLVAVGIIWIVVRNVVQQGSEQFDFERKCLAIDLRAVGVESISGEPGNYSVTLRRAAGGDNIAGIKVALLNATGDSSQILEFGTLSPTQEAKRKISAGILNASRLDYTPYFIDASGNQRLCSQTGQFNF